MAITSDVQIVLMILESPQADVWSRPHDVCPMEGADLLLNFAMPVGRLAQGEPGVSRHAAASLTRSITSQEQARKM